MPRLSLRAELVLALVLPAGLILSVVAWRAETISGRALETALGDRLVAVRADNDTIVLDTDDSLPIGAPYRRGEFDRLELELVKGGAGAASLLFEGPSGRPF